MDLVVGNFDGGCGPKNPGGYGTYGVIVRQNGKILFKDSQCIGDGPHVSNNVAEYAGIIAIFQFLLKESISHGVIYGDSKLVVKQLNGKWRIRGGLYYDYAKEAVNLKRQLPYIQIRWIPREKNREADYLARQAFPRDESRRREIARLVQEQKADQRDTARRMMDRLFR